MDSIAEKIWTYSPPFIIITGTIGNILALITVLNKHCKKSSFTTYIAGLAVADTVVLYLSVIPFWLPSTFDVDLQVTSPVVCKLVWFLSYLSTQTSSWLVSALAAERTFCTYFPHKVKLVCRPKTGYIVIACIVGVMVFLNAHTLYGFQFATEFNTTVCGFVSIEYENFFSFYFPWIDFAIYFLLPTLIVIVANSATVVKVMWSSQSTVASAVMDLNRRKRNRHLLFVTLLVSITFVILISPATLYAVLRPYVVENANSFGRTGIDRLLSTIFFNWGLLNNAVNFILYILSGERFRRDLKHAFCRPETEM